MRTETDGRRRMVGMLFLFLAAGLIPIAVGQRPAAAAVTTVRGSACGYITNVGLFGGPQGLKGCGGGTARNVANGTTTAGSPTVTAAGGNFLASDLNGTVAGAGIPAGAVIVVVNSTTSVDLSVNATATATGVALVVTRPLAATDVSYSPFVNLPTTGSDDPITATDPDGAKAQYGPAVIFGGRWPASLPSAPPSGPIFASTKGTPAGGTVTSYADIMLNDPPTPAPGGFGPSPAEGDSLHVECSASQTATTGSTTFVNATLATATDGFGEPTIVEPVPNVPPVNYTRSGVITNVGDVFTAVYNEQIVNADGSLTVNAVHLYLFGPTAIGELIKGQVTCGTTPPALTPGADTTKPSCGVLVVAPMGPTDPTPQVPRTELIGVFDAGGVASITNLAATNATVSVNNQYVVPAPSSTPTSYTYAPPYKGPLPVSATRTPAAETGDLPMTWSFDVTDALGNTRHCSNALSAPVTLNVSDAVPSPAPEGNTGTSTVTFTISLSTAVTDPVTVGYATGYGSATAGVDYVYTESSVTFTPGATTRPATVMINGDTALEPDETFFVQLIQLVGPGDPQLPQNVTLGDRFGMATIANDDAGIVPAISVNDAAGAENSGALNFTVSLSVPAGPGGVTVKYATQYGSATAGVDYSYQEGMLTFANGESSKPVSVSLIGDTNWEPDETFFVQLYDATGASLADSFGMGTIQNDDAAPTVSIGSPAPVTEGNSGTKTVTFPLSLSPAAGPSGASVSYATQYGSATAGATQTTPGADYVYKEARAIFAPSASTANITVTIIGDTASEGDETFFVQLYDPVGATLGTRFGMATISNDDAAAPVVSIGTGTPDPAPEGNVGGTNTITFPVTLTAPAGAAGVTIAYATMPGYNGSTATSNVDYQYKESTLTIPAGLSAGSIVINIIGDTTAGEGTENLWVQIYNPSGASLNAAARYGEGRIQDDD